MYAYGPLPVYGYGIQAEPMFSTVVAVWASTALALPLPCGRPCARLSQEPGLEAQGYPGLGLDEEEANIHLVRMIVLHGYDLS